MLYQVMLGISKILKGTEIVSAETWIHAATEFSESAMLSALT